VREDLPAGAVAGAAGTWPGGTWESALTCQAFTAVRGAGFEPVGQVFGAAVHAAGYASGYSCPGAWGSAGDRRPAGPPAQVSGRRDAGSFEPLVEAMYQARQTAINRMTAECAALGGHGVVGVRLSRGALPLSGLDFTAAGTSVRVPGAAHGQRALFTCDISGQDFAKLITAGWVPVGLAVGISIGSRHDDRGLAGQARWWSGNVEVAGWTELVNQSRHDARRRLEQDVRRLGGEGVVITGMQMRVLERDCPATVGRRDHIAEVTLTGTAIVRFSRDGHCPAGPALTVMPLGSRRRQAARAPV
jgi:uncharacterized protein YbjQ (UPF0145 family)